MNWIKEKMRLPKVLLGVACFYILLFIAIGIKEGSVVILLIGAIIGVPLLFIQARSLFNLSEKKKIYTEIADSQEFKSIISRRSENEMREAFDKQRKRDHYADSRMILTDDYLYSIKEDKLYVINGILDVSVSLIKQRKAPSLVAQLKVVCAKFVFLYCDGECYQITYTEKTSGNRGEDIEKASDEASRWVAGKSCNYRKHETYRIPTFDKWFF